MDNFFGEAVEGIELMYGKDTVMSLATVNQDKANVRAINAYFRENAFYITTYLLSNKMREILKNPNVALNHNLFVAHGIGENIGNPLDKQNKKLRDELKSVFFKFYDRHVDEHDENTCILRVLLTDALFFTNNYKYYIDFKNQTATRVSFVNDIIV